VRLGRGDGRFRNENTFDVGANPFEVAKGDFDGDGNLDLVVSNSDDDNVSVLPGVGDGRFDPAENYAVGDFPTGLAVRDLDGVNGTDIAVANLGDDDVSVLLNDA
jgi:hypothetical protein